MIRDSLLAVSGTLDKRMFDKGTVDQRQARRSIYLTVKRSNLIPILQLFDAPDAMQSIGKRIATTVPSSLPLSAFHVYIESCSSAVPERRFHCK